MIHILSDHSLPIACALILLLSLCHYVLTDGSDLGIGLLYYRLPEKKRSEAMGSLAPFWDAHATWLVLCVGLLYITFPKTQILFQTCYPVIVLMLLALMLRGAARELQTHSDARPFWGRCFHLSSYATSLTQGALIGWYVTHDKPWHITSLYMLLTVWTTLASYRLLGATWLYAHSETGMLRFWTQKLIQQWVYAYSTLSVITYLLLPSTYTDTGITCLIYMLTYRLHQHAISPCLRWDLFKDAALLILSSILGYACYLYPYIIPFGFDIWECAADPSTLRSVLSIAACMLPWIYLYQYVLYRSFSNTRIEEY